MYLLRVSCENNKEMTCHSFRHSAESESETRKRQDKMSYCNSCTDLFNIRRVHTTKILAKENCVLSLYIHMQDDDDREENEHTDDKEDFTVAWISCWSERRKQ